MMHLRVPVIYSLSFSPDDKQILITSGDSGEVEVWSAPSWGSSWQKKEDGIEIACLLGVKLQVQLAPDAGVFELRAPE